MKLLKKSNNQDNSKSNNPLCIFILFVSLVLAPSFSFAEETFWNLPLAVSDSNTKVTFKIDSTWHMVHGETSGISGKVWLADPLDYRSIRAEIKLPVIRFDTDNGSRDERMREVMDEKNYKQVVFRIVNNQNICDPNALVNLHDCKGALTGEITIHGISKELSIPVSLVKQANNYKVNGEVILSWEDFKVEDPSILIAKLDKKVSINFEIGLNKTN